MINIIHLKEVSVSCVTELLFSNTKFTGASFLNYSINSHKMAEITSNETVSEGTRTSWMRARNLKIQH